VHHAVNDRYLDRNYGGILMIWDRMFGTFVEESERCVYGTRAPLNSWDPLWANLEVYADLARKSWHAERWQDKFLVWLKPPGWRPTDARGAAWQKTAFDVGAVRRFDPPLSAAARVFAAAQITLAVLGATALLWYAGQLQPMPRVLSAVAIIGVLWLTGAVMQGRMRVRSALVLQAVLVGALFGAWIY
jgi:hypothetical protein